MERHLETDYQTSKKRVAWLMLPSVKVEEKKHNNVSFRIVTQLEGKILLKTLAGVGLQG